VEHHVGAAAMYLICIQRVPSLYLNQITDHPDKIFCVVLQPVQANSRIFLGVASAASLSVLSSSSDIILSHHFIVNNLCIQYIIII
jgi:hypothetical protein